MSEIKRYARRLTRTQIELAQPRTEFVLASDYAALEAERDALRQQRDKLAGYLRAASKAESRHELMHIIDAALAEIKP